MRKPVGAAQSESNQLKFVSAGRMKKKTRVTSPDDLNRGVATAMQCVQHNRHRRGDAAEHKATLTSSNVTVVGEPSHRQRRAAKARIRCKTASVSARNCSWSFFATQSAVYRDIEKASPAIARSLVRTYEAIHLSIPSAPPGINTQAVAQLGRARGLPQAASIVDAHGNAHPRDLEQNSHWYASSLVI